MAIKKKLRYLNTDIAIVEQADETPMLLQSDKLYPLSEFYANGYDVVSITNCSYFNGKEKYVNGRNQGDLKDETYSDSENCKWCDLVFFKDGTFKVGKFNSWDYRGENVLAGFSPVVMKVNGKFLYSDLIKDWKSRMTTRSQHTAVCATKDNKIIQVVSEGRSTSDIGLTGNKLFEYLESLYDLQVIALLDGGGSSEMIYEGEIVTQLENNTERPMLNGFALVKKKEKPKDIEIKFPCADGWISQDFHKGHMALDIGWLKKCSSNGKTPIYACADGVVEVADYYEEVVSGKKVKPIVCILRHDDLDPNYTYYSAYWHLASTPKNTGDVVKMGEQIGIKGNTGYSGGVHLHFVLMRCPKGTKCPTSYQFNTYAIDPKPYIFLTPEQVFDGKKTYEFPIKEKDISDEPSKPEEPEIPYEDIDVLKEEIALLEAQVKALETKISSLESEKNKYKTQIDTLNDSLNKSNAKLNAIGQYAEQIIALTK